MGFTATMRFATALAIFIVAIAIEHAFLPAFLGFYLPLASWSLVVFFVVLEANQTLWLSLVAGFLFSAIRTGPPVFFFVSWAVIAVIIVLVKIWLEGDSFIRNISALACGLLLLNLLPLVFLPIFDLTLESLAMPRRIIADFLFLLGMIAVFFFYEKKRHLAVDFL